MLDRNPALAAIDQGGIAFGTTAQMGSVEICELQARAGFEFIFIDMEHGSFAIERATSMIRGVQSGGPAAIFVRVPDHSPTNIFKVLDAGATGVIAANVETAAQMRGIVEAAHFSPRGFRAACPAVRATGHGFVPWADYLAWCADNIFVCGTVETALGVANFDEIIAVEGLDAVAIGNFDLSQAMGHGGDYKHPAVTAKYEELIRKARARGIEVFAGIIDFAAMEQDVSRLIELGVRYILYGSDRFLLTSTYRDAGARLKAISTGLKA